MSLFIYNNANIQFAEKKLIWRYYIVAEALSTTKRVELINKKQFAKTALDEKSKTFVVHIVTLRVSPGLAKMTIHPLLVA